VFRNALVIRGLSAWRVIQPPVRLKPANGFDLLLLNSLQEVVRGDVWTEQSVLNAISNVQSLVQSDTDLSSSTISAFNGAIEQILSAAYS
jgi:hypothetical protein